MRIRIHAVGRQKAGPERDLVEDYLKRFNRTGRQFGLGPAELFEVEDRKGGGMAKEAELLSRNIPENGVLICLDERGTSLTSPAFSQKLCQWRDEGQGSLTFVIGGADGIDPSLRERAGFSMRFGRMVWPHMLARVMLTEQLYRAATIVAGTPYHRS